MGKSVAVKRSQTLQPRIVGEALHMCRNYCRQRPFRSPSFLMGLRRSAGFLILRGSSEFKVLSSEFELPLFKGTGSREQGLRLLRSKIPLPPLIGEGDRVASEQSEVRKRGGGVEQLQHIHRKWLLDAQRRFPWPLNSIRPQARLPLNTKSAPKRTRMNGLLPPAPFELQLRRAVKLR